MIKRVKIPGMSLRGLVAGGLLAGAVGFGFGEGGYGGTSGEPGTSNPAAEDQGVGGSQGPGMAATEAAALPPNVAPGWKIRVCSEKTKAQSINFRVMSADDKSAKNEKKAADKTTAAGDPSVTDQTAASAGTQETASWTKGDPSLINLPESVARLERIRIEATPAQEDMKSEVCVLYNDHVTKKMSFDEKQTATVKMNENGTCGC
jgi:hypothetical protein